jgi:16S rRNA (guanine(966)-N(2))-methyltransferase RsmD
MKVIAGSARGTNLFSPNPDHRIQHIRPTLGRIREAIFSMLYSIFGTNPDGRVADLYAGTGALGIEALSRGASFCLFIDQSPEAIELTTKNLIKTHLTSRAEVIKTPLPAGIQRLANDSPQQRYQIILIDPPYSDPKQNLPNPSSELLEQLAKMDLLADQGVIVVQVEKNLALESQYGKLNKIKERVYGETSIQIFQQPTRSTS